MWEQRGLMRVISLSGDMGKAGTGQGGPEAPLVWGGRIETVPHHRQLLPAGTGGQREEERPGKSLHVWALPRCYCLPADAETPEESLLSFPSELSVLERLGLHR